MTKWSRKPRNKNILVHFLSSHPSHTKRTLIRNMFRTATPVCTGRELKEESRGLARQTAISNGYEIVAPRDKSRRRATSQNERFDQSKVPFNLPFINDEVSVAMKRCLRRAGLEESVSIVEISPNSLRRLLVRGRLCITENCVICPYGRDVIA